MRPLTDRTPKPLLTLAGRPLLEHHILNLKSAGFDQLIINASYLGEQIAAFAATEVTGVFPSESLTRMNRWRRQVASLRHSSGSRLTHFWL